MRFDILCFILIVFASNTRGSHHADSLLNSLKHEEWADDEEPCKTATFALLHGVQNHTTWATWIWDSMQIPVSVLQGSRYHLGSFDQCLGVHAPWHGASPMDTQYCVVDVTLTEETRPNEVVDPYGKVQDFVKIQNKYSRRLNHYSLGVCLPRACSPSSVTKISRHIHRLTHLPFGDVKLDPSNCQFGEERAKTLGFYIFWWIIAMLTILASAFYIVKEEDIKKPFLLNLAKWFSPSRNFDMLTDMKHEELKSLNGVRTMCSGTAVSMHYFFYSSIVVFNTGDMGYDIHEDIFGRYLIQMALVIDVFFAMSGILHMKGLLTSNCSLLKLLIKRYFRLLPTLAISLLYLSRVLEHTVAGPLYPKLMKEQVDICTRNWWHSVLMINNYVKSDEYCHIVTWYISCDYQLTILGTLIFCFCQKLKKRTATTLCAVIFLVSLVIPGAVTYWNELPPILAYNSDSASITSENRVFKTSYTKSHNRASAYLIGLALGYFMHVYKPQDYRHTISKSKSIFGVALGFGILVSVMGAGGILIRGEYNPLASSLYTALDRSIFTLGSCLIIIVCEYGDCPIFGDFFTSKVFVPLSRLSYGMYLYHPALIYMNIYSIKIPPNYSCFLLFLHGFGYIVVSLLLSYVVWFIVDAPLASVINYLFRNRKGKTKVQNIDPPTHGAARQNGTKSTKIL